MNTLQEKEPYAVLSWVALAIVPVSVIALIVGCVL